MYPVLVDWGPIFLPTWHVFFVLGSIFSFFSLNNLNRRLATGFKAKQLQWLFLAGYIGGYFGARIYSLIIDEGLFPTTFAFYKGLAVLGPMTLYGGLLGAAIGMVLVASALKISYPKLIDVVVPSGFVGVAIGRLGCFLNGDDFGLPISTSYAGKIPWWAVVFPNLNDGIPRYPTQLVESGSIVVILTVVIWCHEAIRRRLGSGGVGVVTLVAYAVTRFFIEFWRGDERGWIIPQRISPAQGISILLVIFGLFFLRLTNRRRRDSAQS